MAHGFNLFAMEHYPSTVAQTVSRNLTRSFKWLRNMDFTSSYLSPTTGIYLVRMTPWSLAATMPPATLMPRCRGITCPMTMVCVARRIHSRICFSSRDRRHGPLCQPIWAQHTRPVLYRSIHPDRLYEFYHSSRFSICQQPGYLQLGACKRSEVPNFSTQKILIIAHPFEPSGVIPPSLRVRAARRRL